MPRPYSYGRDLKGGCYVCNDGIAHWFGPNTQGVAARHYDATGHVIWVEVAMHIQYRLDEEKGD